MEGIKEMKKTLQECKEVVAKENGYPNWQNVIENFFGTVDLYDLANKMYYEQSEAETEYELHFGSALKAKIKISNNIIEVIGAVDGWGNDAKSNITIEHIPNPPQK